MKRSDPFPLWKEMGKEAGPSSIFDVFDWYRAAVMRTANLTGQARVNAVLGLNGEAGEVAELIKKQVFHGKHYTNEEIADELGDVLYYLTWLATLYGWDLDTIMKMNIAKLHDRYPEGFTGDTA